MQRNPATTLPCIGFIRGSGDSFMTEQELSEENHYRFEERLALLCGMDVPTAAQICLAIDEAQEACEKLRNEKQR